MSEEERRPLVLTPWKVSVAGSMLGLAFALLFAIFPSLRSIPTPGGGATSMLYPVLGIPIIASIWAAAGLLLRKRDAHTSWCYLSLVLSFFAVAFASLAAWMDSGA